MNLQKNFAELIGTYLLTLSVLLSVNATPASLVVTPIIAGLVLAICVYTIGAVSGCHINPAVTLSLLSGGAIKTTEALYYIVFQLVGAALAATTLYLLTGAFMGLGFAAEFSWLVFFTELLGAAFFLFGISAAVWGKVPSVMNGIVIGSSLLISVLLAAHSGGLGILNPAVALGLGGLNLATLLGPIVGGVIGVKVYKGLVK
jgi:aquaporin Z